MKNIVQVGDSMDVVVAGSPIVGGTVGVIGTVAGVWEASGAVGAYINLKTEGVFTLPKSAGGGTGLSQGAKVYWTGTVVSATAAGNTPLGRVWKVALDADTTVHVRLVRDSESGVAADVTVLAGTLTGTVDGTMTNIAATAASTAGGATPTAANVDAGIATAVASIVTGTNTELKELQTKLNDLITKLAAGGVIG